MKTMITHRRARQVDRRTQPHIHEWLLVRDRVALTVARSAGVPLPAPDDAQGEIIDPLIGDHYGRRTFRRWDR